MVPVTLKGALRACEYSRSPTADACSRGRGTGRRLDPKHLIGRRRQEVVLAPVVPAGRARRRRGGRRLAALQQRADHEEQPRGCDAGDAHRRQELSERASRPVCRVRYRCARGNHRACAGMLGSRAPGMFKTFSLVATRPGEAPDVIEVPLHGTGVERFVWLDCPGPPLAYIVDRTHMGTFTDQVLRLEPAAGSRLSRARGCRRGAAASGGTSRALQGDLLVSPLLPLRLRARLGLTSLADASDHRLASRR